MLYLLITRYRWGKEIDTLDATILSKFDIQKSDPLYNKFAVDLVHTYLEDKSQLLD